MTFSYFGVPQLGRAHLTVAERLAWLSQDHIRLSKMEFADMADIHDRNLLLGAISSTLRSGASGLEEAWSKRGGVARYLTILEEDIAAFKAGGWRARRARRFLRDITTYWYAPDFYEKISRNLAAYHSPFRDDE